MCYHLLLFLTSANIENSRLWFQSFCIFNKLILNFQRAKYCRRYFLALSFHHSLAHSLIRSANVYDWWCDCAAVIVGVGPADCLIWRFTWCRRTFVAILQQRIKVAKPFRSNNNERVNVPLWRCMLNSQQSGPGVNGFCARWQWVWLIVWNSNSLLSSSLFLFVRFIRSFFRKSRPRSIKTAAAAAVPFFVRLKLKAFAYIHPRLSFSTFD